MADPLPELKTLGRYTIERTIGSGAMGVVYEGVDPTLGRRVAIKTILKTQLDEDTAKEYSKRFLREAKAVARLNHPNIVQVYDFGEAGEVAYLVMEFIKGKELKSFFEANERFELKEVVRIMGELCEALEFAHNAGIIHRDIKPANVMLDAHAHTKLTDFGVARVQDADKTMERTQAGTLVGTPAYMSPEQITGVNIDKRSDVFSAGIILYQFLTGEKPFTGSGAWTIAKKILHEEPPLPSSLNNAVTPLFDAVVNKALAKRPDQRFQSARELGAALKSALEGKTVEESDKTVAMPMGGAMPIARVPARAHDSDATVSNIEEAELEFWRAIKDGNDAHDFELYVQQFPNGIYAALAKRKIAKLRGEAHEDAKAAEEEKKELQEAAQREAEAKAKLEAEKARLEAEIRRKEEEYRRREAEAVAKGEAEAKARAEEETKASNARRRALRTVAIVGGLVIAAVSSVIYIQLQDVARERDAAIARAQQADEARRHAEELSAKADDAMKQANEAFERFQQAVLAENRARAAGDAERMKQLAEARRKAEEDANQRRQVAEALVRQANDAKRNAPPVVTTAPTVAPPTAAATKPPAQETAKAPAAAQGTEVAAAAQTPKPAAVESGKAPPPEKADLDPFKLAQSLEAKNGKEAVRAYSALAKSGNCEAARRLGQIYEKGVRDVPRDYQESLQWYRRAEQLGCKVTRATGRV